MASCCGLRRDRHSAALAGRGEDGRGRTRGPRPPWLSPHEAPRQPGRVLVSCTVTPRPDARRGSPCLGKGAGRRVFPFTGRKGQLPRPPSENSPSCWEPCPRRWDRRGFAGCLLVFCRGWTGAGKGGGLWPRSSFLRSRPPGGVGDTCCCLPGCGLPSPIPAASSPLPSPSLAFVSPSLSRRHFLVRLGDGVCGFFGDISGRKTLAASG